MNWRKLHHPLALVLRFGWRWGRDPRAGDKPCLISKRGVVYEFRHNRAGAFARRFQNFALN